MEGFLLKEGFTSGLRAGPQGSGQNANNEEERFSTYAHYGSLIGPHNFLALYLFLFCAIK